MINFILELLPLSVFFYFYKNFNIEYATIALILASTATLGFSYFTKKTLPSKPAIIGLGLLIVMGLLTVVSGNSLFIKMKPTILNLAFGVILVVGLIMKKGLVKYMFGGQLIMTERSWIIFSRRWAFFFFFLAVLNETVWRNFPEEMWVNFKVFGLLPITIIFTLTQLPFLIKNKVEENV